MSDEPVRFDLKGSVATITIDSPATRNALSRAVVAGLRRALNAAQADERVRIVVLTATGSSFCTGADLKEARESSEAGAVSSNDLLVSVIEDLWNSPKPVVGRINGLARAGGLGLVAACDITIAVATATFSFTEVRLGLAPAIVSVVTLPKIGITHGMELFLTGQTFEAREAQRIGLLTMAVPESDLDVVVDRYVSSLLKGGPKALGEAKRLVREVPGLPVPEAFERMKERSAALFASEEGLEGMRAFAERRAPRWVKER